MRNSAKGLGPAFVAFAALVVACHNSPSAPSASTLAGTWTASRMEFVSQANPATSVDVVANGATVTLQMTETHQYTLTVQVAGQPDDITTGTWSASGDVMTMTVAGLSGERQFNMSLTGNTITLSGADASFDFNDDGVDEDAKLSMVLTK